MLIKPCFPLYEIKVYYYAIKLRLNHFGGVESIASSIEVRDSYINAPADDIIQTYEAYYKLRELMHHEDFMISYKMKEGDILVFDNKRVLHARTSFDTSKTTRWLQGCYVEWDEVYSTFRILKKKSMKQ